MFPLYSNLSISLMQCQYPKLQASKGQKPVSCGQNDSPSKALRQLPEAIERVEVGGLAIARQGVAVQLDPLQGVSRRFVQVVIIPVHKVTFVHSSIHSQLLHTVQLLQSKAIQL